MNSSNKTAIMMSMTSADVSAALAKTQFMDMPMPHVNFPNCIFKAVLKKIVGIVRASA